MSNEAERPQETASPPIAWDTQSPVIAGSPRGLSPSTDTLQSTKIYGTPRVFDLFTMLAVTFAFALLVAFTNMLFGETSKGTTVVIALYVTFIGLGQAVLFQGSEPRIASLVAGPVVMAVMYACYGLFNQGRWNISDLASSLCVVLAFGLPAGYLSGATVAGVFLVADAMRKRPLLQSKNKADQDRDIRFDDVE